MFTFQKKREPSWTLPEKREYLLEDSKAFRIYISRFHHIDISRDATFDEETTLKKYRRCQLEELHEEDVPPKKVEVAPSPESEIS